MPASVSPSPSTTPKLAGRSLARHATLEKAHDLKALSPFKIVLQPGFVKTDLNHGHGAVRRLRLPPHLWLRRSE
ncbi:hypothetical protein PRIC1_003463 [Phytophthora ramorum]|uniref:uncharacterized protein n=1 Tax=Phytophthora ramorum TaxID=164328 RepID=UPI0030AA850E|nr:hypothetical protein KRP23_8285 [Phytophthora ramorum]KAH7484161.1 hypothetical protein KRP23_3232 [Phytophthora ramorum]